MTFIEAAVAWVRLHQRFRALGVTVRLGSRRQRPAQGRAEGPLQVVFEATDRNGVAAGGTVTFWDAGACESYLVKSDAGPALKRSFALHSAADVRPVLDEALCFLASVAEGERWHDVAGL